MTKEKEDVVLGLISMLRSALDDLEAELFEIQDDHEAKVGHLRGRKTRSEVGRAKLKVVK